jgi:hypothetical protein
MGYTNIQKIYDLARDNYGVVTVDAVKGKGIDPVNLRKLAMNNEMIEQGARGVYIFWDDPEDKIDYTYTNIAKAVAVAGKDSFALGDTVLALFNLANASPNVDYVAILKQQRVAKRPVVKKLFKHRHDDEVINYKGLPIQNPKYALLTSYQTPYEYLADGASAAFNENIISKNDYNFVVDNLAKGTNYAL